MTNGTTQDFIEVWPSQLRVGDTIRTDDGAIRKVTNPVWVTCYLTQVIPTDSGLVVVYRGLVLKAA